jgi:hypothetical protein
LRCISLAAFFIYLQNNHTWNFPFCDEYGKMKYEQLFCNEFVIYLLNEVDHYGTGRHF